MLRLLALMLVSFVAMSSCLAQLPHPNSRDSAEKKMAFKPYLGRVAIYNEFIGPASGLTLNVEAFPVKLDLVSLSIRVGTTTEIVENTSPAWGRFAMVYSLGTELGRRRSRFNAGFGLVTRYFLPGEYYFGRQEKGRINLDWFASIGYRLQMPWGLFLGLNANLVFFENDDGGCLVCDNDYKGPKLYPSVQLGFRLPSSVQHRWYRKLHTLSPQMRDSLKVASTFQRLKKSTIPDSLRVADTGGSEFGFSILGTALFGVHYTYFAQLLPNGVAHYYVRPGIGSVSPLLQFQLETGMAFLWKNSGFSIGGGGSASVGVGKDVFLITRGRRNFKMGFSASLGVALIWSEQAPFFSSVAKRSGIGWVMPSVSFAYRLPKRKL